MTDIAIRVENLSKGRFANGEFRNPQVVLNAVPTHRGSYYYYSYHETYGNGTGRRKHRRRRLFGRRRKADYGENGEWLLLTAPVLRGVWTR